MAKFDISTIKSKGRPKGSKNQVYLTLNYWYCELMKDWKKLRPSQRAKFSVQLMQMLTNKMKTMPGTPEQSVLNTEDAAKMLAELSQEKPLGEQTNASSEQTPVSGEQTLTIEASQSFVDPNTPTP